MDDEEAPAANLFDHAVRLQSGHCLLDRLTRYAKVFGETLLQFLSMTRAAFRVR